MEHRDLKPTNQNFSSIEEQLSLLISFFCSQEPCFWNNHPEEFHAMYQELCEIKLKLESNV
jgi:hypothetical protein